VTPARPAGNAAWLGPRITGWWPTTSSAGRPRSCVRPPRDRPRDVRRRKVLPWPRVSACPERKVGFTAADVALAPRNESPDGGNVAGVGVSAEPPATRTPRFP